MADNSDTQKVAAEQQQWNSARDNSHARLLLAGPGGLASSAQPKAD